MLSRCVVSTQGGDCRFVLDDLKIKLAVCTLALLMLNSAEMYHSTVRLDSDPKAQSPRRA